MEYYIAVKKSEIIIFTGKWVDLEDIKSSKVTQTQKEMHFPSYVNLSHICVNICK